MNGMQWIFFGLLGGWGAICAVLVAFVWAGCGVKAPTPLDERGAIQ
jgi:hypothetical protein